MASVNKVLLIGYLGKDPEVRYSQGGTCFANMSLATSYKPKEGEAKTEWHKLVAIGRTGEVCGEYLQKGSLVFIEGRLQTREWEDKEGVKRYTTEIVVDRMQMLDSKGDKQQGSSDPFNGMPDNIPDEDVPF